MIDKNNLYYDTNAQDKFPEPSVDESVANPNNILDGRGYIDPVTRQIRFGTMPDNTGWNHTLQLNERIMIPIGYHDGKGYVEVGGIESFTQGTATAEDIVFNKVAWVNGVRIVGTLDKDENDQVGNATANDLLVGKVAWANRQRIEGNIPVLPRMDKTLRPGETYTFPKGYSVGTTVFNVPDLSTFTVGTATPDKLLKGETAWVDGEKITGTFDIQDYVTGQLDGETSAKAKDIRIGKKAYTELGVLTGTMPDHLEKPPITLRAGVQYNIPLGYHDGNGVIKSETLAVQTVCTATENDIRTGKTAWCNGVLVEGKMDQYITTALDTTATVYDIRVGKTAYIKGRKRTGESLYDIIDYVHEADNIDDHSGVVVNVLPRFDWKFVAYMGIDLVDSNTGYIVKQHTEKYYHRNAVIETDWFKVTSAPDDNKIIITPKSILASQYIKSVIVGYDFNQIIDEEELSPIIDGGYSDSAPNALVDGGDANDIVYKEPIVDGGKSNTEI